MKVIVLVRHGKSDWDFLGVSDFNRPLSERGIRDVLAQGQALLREGYRPDYILTSPAIRAWHTAHLLAQVSSLSHEAVKPDMGFYREDREAIEVALSQLPEEVSTVLLVGHNPLWSEVASAWSGEPLELATSEMVGWGWTGTWAEFEARQFKRLFYLRRTG